MEDNEILCKSAILLFKIYNIGECAYMKKISNPLTIIGIFAGIAEVAGTAVLPLVSEALQKVFIWYVMGFPVLLVLLFFVTLNRNPKVLYAPSDFTDEKNFMKLLSEADSIIQKTIEKKTDIEADLKGLEEWLEETSMKVRESHSIDNLVGEEIIQVKYTEEELSDTNKPAFAFFKIKDKRIPLIKDTIVIGRDKDADICIQDVSVSKKHGQIIKNNNDFYITDLGAINGILINGKRLEKCAHYKLSDGDNISFGKINVMFCIASLEAD